jgi:hypothetical protein
MKYSLADFTDRDKLSHVLTQVLLLVEHLNQLCLTQVRKEPLKRKSIKEVLLLLLRTNQNMTCLHRQLTHRFWSLHSGLQSQSFFNC